MPTPTRLSALCLAALEARANTVYYRKDGRIYMEVTADNGAVSGALRDTRNQLVNNRKFCRKLREWAKNYDEMLSALNREVSDTYTHKVEYFLTNDTGLEKLCTAIDLAPAFTVGVNATVRNLTRKAEKLSVGLYREGTAVWEFAFDVSAKDAATFSVTAAAVTRKLTLTGIEKNRKTFSMNYELSCRTGMYSFGIRNRIFEFFHSKTSLFIVIVIVFSISNLLISSQNIDHVKIY